MTLPLMLLPLALAALVYFVWNLGRRRQPSPVASILLSLALLVAAAFVVALLEWATGGWLIPSAIIVAGWFAVFGVLIVRGARRIERTS
jgi:hypothetical protein